MANPAQPVALQEAVTDLESRTLSAFDGPFARLIYLASMRDYNTGQYFHEGLSDRFGEGSAGQALAICHEGIFEELVGYRLKELVQAVGRYVGSHPAGPDDVLSMWETLEPFRLAVPARSDRLARDLFASNVRIAVAILRARRSVSGGCPPAASPQP